MLTKSRYIKFFIAVVLVFITQATIASFTGNLDDNRDKFSLKSLNHLAKNYSLSSLRGNFQYRGSLDLNQQFSNNTVEVNSMIRFEKGNTTYVYPYTYKVKVPRFKTPSQPQQ